MFNHPRYHQEQESKEVGFQQLLDFGNAAEGAAQILGVLLPNGFGTAAMAAAKGLGVANKVLDDFSHAVDNARSIVDRYSMYSIGGLRAAQSIHIADIRRQVAISRELQGSMIGFADSFNKMNDSMKDGIVFINKFGLSVGKVGADVAGWAYGTFVSPIMYALDGLASGLADWTKKTLGIDLNFPTTEEAKKKREELVQKRQAAMRGELPWEQAKDVISPLEFALGMGPQKFAGFMGNANAALKDRQRANRAGAPPAPGGAAAGGFVNPNAPGAAAILPPIPGGGGKNMVPAPPAAQPPAPPPNMQPQAPAVDPALLRQAKNLNEQEATLRRLIAERGAQLDALKKDAAGVAANQGKIDALEKQIAEFMTDLDAVQDNKQKVQAKLPADMKPQGPAVDPATARALKQARDDEKGLGSAIDSWNAKIWKLETKANGPKGTQDDKDELAAATKRRDVIAKRFEDTRRRREALEGQIPPGAVIDEVPPANGPRREGRKQRQPDQAPDAQRKADALPKADATERQIVDLEQQLKKNADAMREQLAKNPDRNDEAFRQLDQRVQEIIRSINGLEAKAERGKKIQQDLNRQLVQPQANVIRKPWGQN